MNGTLHCGIVLTVEGEAAAVFRTWVHHQKAVGGLVMGGKQMAGTKRRAGTLLLWSQTVPEHLLGEQAHADFATVFLLGHSFLQTDIH